MQCSRISPIDVDEGAPPRFSLRRYPELVAGSQGSVAGTCKVLGRVGPEIGDLSEEDIKRMMAFRVPSDPDFNDAPRPPTTQSGAEWGGAEWGGGLTQAAVDDWPSCSDSDSPKSSTGNASGRGPEWSEGAKGHEQGTCKPCAWHWKREGCQKASRCTYCHMCPDGELRRRRWAKLEMRRRARKRSSETAVAYFSSSCSSTSLRSYSRTSSRSHSGSSVNSSRRAATQSSRSHLKGRGLHLSRMSLKARAKEKLSKGVPSHVSL
mmetsp:Transcript_73685/g.203433  ORF Transcript_73685/g.203433 Transcript_73685/m.203433 type:complete len:264 (+) Transcript_73685:81-872(+)